MNDIEELARSARTVALKQLHQKAGWLILSREDLEDCLQIAALRIAEVGQSQQQGNGFLVMCGAQAVVRWLVGNHKRRLGWAEKEFLTSQRENSLSFVERNLNEIYELLLESRQKKGDRGQQAANREALIIYLLDCGMRDTAIAEELELPVPHVHDYRRQLRRRLISIHQKKEKNGNENQTRTSH